MRPFDFRNWAGQANDLTAWAITVGDWVNYRLLKRYMNNLNSLKVLARELARWLLWREA